MPGPLMTRVAGDWVVARYGVQIPQFLSKFATWGPISTAAWFSDREASHTASCPPGTTGIAMKMNALPTSLALESLGRGSMGYGAIEWTVHDAMDLPVLDVRRAP